MADYEVRLTLLTPLHLRHPGERRAGWDFVAEDGRLWVLDLNRLYRELWGGSGPVPTPLELLRGRRAAPYATYSLRVLGEAPQSYWPLMRGPMDQQPYVPGSSLKGLVRTALLWHLFNGVLPELGNSARTAAQPLELAAFGHDPSGRRHPNYSLARAILPEDLRPAGEAECWVAPAYAYGLDRAGRLVRRVPLGHLEVVVPGASFRGRLRVDEWLLARSELRFPGGGVEAARRLPQALTEFGRALLAAEVRFYRAGQERRLADRLEGLGPGQGAVACLGWGGGWASKTVGLKLRAEDVRRVAQHFDLRRWQGRHFPHHFPASRRLVMTPEGPLPLGWVRVELHPRGG